MIDGGPSGLDAQALVKAWRDTEASLPEDVELCGVVYHGPDCVPGREWILLRAVVHVRSIVGHN